MAEKLLTDTKVRHAKRSPRERLLSDGSGLYLRIRESGKDWLFIYSLRGKRRKQGLGSYPDVSLDRAREKAAESRAFVADGRDAIQAVADLQNAQQAATEAAARRKTVSGLFEDWHSTLVVRRKDKGAETRRLFEKDILPIIGDRFADEITRRDVMAVLDEIRKRGANRMLNIALQMMGQMFWFGTAREIVRVDPTAGITRKDAGGKERERTRVLSELEIRTLAVKLPGAGLLLHTQDAFWIVLATCCRLGELVNAEWAHVDLKAQTWVIPAGNSKNGREHLIHLSDFAKERLEMLKEHCASATWLYPTRKGTGPMIRNALQRQFHDRQIDPGKCLKAHRVSEEQALVVEGGIWTAHDLRRTGATMMGELGIHSDVIDRVLNHVEPKKVTRTYQRQVLMAERKRAFEVLGERLNLLYRTDQQNIVVGKFRQAG